MLLTYKIFSQRHTISGDIRLVWPNQRQFEKKKFKKMYERQFEELKGSNSSVPII